MTDCTATPRRHRAAFAISNFAIGPAFGGFHSYVTFQIQAIGYAIGHQPGMEPGSGCPRPAKSCRVPWLGSGDVNLTSFLLYLNAIAYAVAGALLFLLSGVGNHLPRKREQYVALVVLYGALCLPVAALTSLDAPTFHTLAALHVVFGVVGYIKQVWANLFVPFAMRGEDGSQRLTSTRRSRQLRGLAMSIWGFAALNLSIVVFYLVVLALTFSTAAHAGLSMTTAAGATCVVLGLAAWRFLPTPGGKPLPKGSTWWSLPLRSFSQFAASLGRYSDALRFLMAYTVYNDAHFAFGTVTGTLFNLTARPSVREFTAYSMVGPVTSLVVGISWLRLFPHCRLSLRHWAMGCYAVVSVVAVWTLLGLSPSSRIGLKHRWEFYAISIVQSAAGAVIVPLFRVLFSELFPSGSEVGYFGLQMVLSCGTNWIAQVVNAPIVDATNNARVPAAVCLAAWLLCILMTWWTDDERGVAAVQAEAVVIPPSTY